MSASDHRTGADRGSGGERADPASQSEGDIDARLANIRRAFLARSAEQLQALEALASTRFTEATRAEVTASVHRLAGSAGTFGFRAVSRVAGELEDALRAPETGLDDAARLLDDAMPNLALALAHAATEAGPAENAGGARGDPS